MEETQSESERSKRIRSSKVLSGLVLPSKDEGEVQLRGQETERRPEALGGMRSVGIRSDRVRSGASLSLFRNGSEVKRISKTNQKRECQHKEASENT